VRSFKQLQKKLHYLNQKQIDRIYQAYLIAYSAHSGQKRSSGEAYISHPLEVASILADMHMDPESIMAALLHDVIEDTSVDKEMVARRFKKTVAELVDGVTKLTRMQFSTMAEAQAESLRKMILAMSRDIRVILIKLADRLHNMHTLSALPHKKRQRIAKETLDIYAPIARRLGIHDLYIELENLSFIELYPKRYQVLAKEVKKARGNRKEIMKDIEKQIKKFFAHSGFPKIQISGREKDIYSIYKKMLKKHLTFSEIMDVYGFRIITNSIDECYRALGIIHSLYKPVPGKFKDYIAIPKINGYQSLHTTLFGPQGIPVEIQIRTKDMDQTAGKGIAAHWLYKTAEKIDEAHIRAQQWINDILEMQQKTGSSLEFVENVRVDLFPEEIYVFTPKGTIIELPKGATALDFAYAIHTDIGNYCISVKIDRQPAPLSAELTNGQTIAVKTSQNARPNPAWLNFVKTSKARSSIRHFLKNQHHSELILLGKTLLTKALGSLSLTLAKIPRRALNALLKDAKLANPDNLYEDIGLGNRAAIFVAHQLADIAKSKRILKREAETAKAKEKPLLIKGTEGMAVTFAGCCNPVPGDHIAGCFSIGHGLIIHTDDCKNIARLREQPGKCVLTRWADNIKGEFPVVINVEITSTRGSFAALSVAISEADSNIDDISVNKRTGEYYLVTLRILVRNRDHLHQVLNHLDNLPIVNRSWRV
jgi:guanosine-3',5'-bis(diphosphate) 3'-pyrophosphohydrolase